MQVVCYTLYSIQLNLSFFPYWESVVLLNIIENHLIPQALQGQISSQQVAVEKLKKTAEVLLDAKGSLLPAKNDIQKTLGKVLACS